MEFVDIINNFEYEVTMLGRFTFTDNGKFRTILDKFSKPEIKHISFNMKEVSFVDSAALGMLLLARDEAAKYNKELKIKDTVGQVKKMFEIAQRLA